MLNRPETVTGLTWRGEDGALRLSWQAGEETAGEVVVDRAEGDTWTAAIARVPVGQTEWRDTTVTPGARYTYRLRMTNTSGTGEASEVRSYVSAPGTVAMRETFDAKADRALPATGDGKTSLGPWLWVGQNGDKQPAIRAVDGSPTQDPPATGALCWGIVRGGARSFVRTETFSANLAGAGARVSWDMKIDGSAMATHQVALCLRLADGSWIATDAGYTPAQKGWSSREYLLADQTWFALNPQTASLGAKVATPDLAQVTGLGFYIDRPINNRSIWLDNVVAWGVAWGR
jgi:hypothetical protein